MADPPNRRQVLAAGLVGAGVGASVGAAARSGRPPPRPALSGDRPYFTAQDVGLTRDTPAGPVLQALFDRARDTTLPNSTLMFGNGDWLLGDQGVRLETRNFNLIGQGINTTVLYAGGRDSDIPPLFLDNFAGTTSGFWLRTGVPGEVLPPRVERDGILFEWGGGHGRVQDIQVDGFEGAGISFVNAWDSVISNIITVRCGSERRAAIEIINAHGGTSNHLFIERVQCEDSIGKAFLCSPENGFIDIIGFHSEGTVGSGKTYTHVVQGGACTFRNFRIDTDAFYGERTGPVSMQEELRLRAAANIRVLLGGSNSLYENFVCSESSLTDYIWGVNDPRAGSLISSSWFHHFRIPSANAGSVTISDSVIALLEVTDQPGRVVLRNCTIGDVRIAGNGTDVSFEGGRVTGNWSVAGNVTVRCRAGTRLSTAPAAASLMLDDCEVAGRVTTAFNQQIVARDCRFLSDVILSNNGGKAILTGATDIGGRLGYAAGGAFGALGPDVRVVGPIDPRWYGTGGAWPRGTRRWRPDAGPGDPAWHLFDGRGWRDGT